MSQREIRHVYFERRDTPARNHRVRQWLAYDYRSLIVPPASRPQDTEPQATRKAIVARIKERLGVRRS